MSVAPAPSSSAAVATTDRFLIGPLHEGLPNDSTFKLESVPVPAPKDGELLVKALYISVDPYLRGMVTKIGAGKPMVSGLVAEVLESKAEGFKAGEHVCFYGNWARVQVVNPKSEDARLLKVDGSVAPLSTYLGVLGMPGATAYFGLKDAASFKKGDIVLVSGAAGAVGSMVGQLAKIWGAKLVVGTAGGPEKCKLVTEKFGFDACIDYKQFKTREAVRDELKRLSPDGVDVYFENTGGHVTDAFFDVIRQKGRVAVCGQISTYNSALPTVPSNMPAILYASARVQGFLVFEYQEQWADFERDVTPLVVEGKLKYEETVVEGLEQLPKALRGLFEGANVGKMVVKI